MSKKKITKEEVEEVRHLVEKQEQAEELPYAVRNLNLPDLEDEPPCTVNDDLNLRVAELYREKTGVYPSWYLMVEGRVKALAEELPTFVPFLDGDPNIVDKGPGCPNQSKEDYLEEKRHLIELNEHKNFAREDLEDDLEDADYLASKQDAEEEDAWEAKRELAREDREDEEIDRLAREEVERSLYEDGIIEAPDCDGGLNG